MIKIKFLLKNRKIIKRTLSKWRLGKTNFYKSEEIIGKRIKIILGVRKIGKNPFKNLDRFKIDLTEATFSDYEGCDIVTSSISFNSFELIIREESFSVTIEGLEPAYAYANKYIEMEVES